MEFEGIYQCRMCGQRFVNFVDDSDAAYRKLDGVAYNSDWYMRKCAKTKHICYGGNIGIADFVGLRVEDCYE